MLLYFSAPWCVPCRTFGPIVEKVTAELDIPVTKYIVEEALTEAWKYKIMSIPTIVVVFDDREVSRYTGACDENQLRVFLDETYLRHEGRYIGPSRPPLPEPINKIDLFQ